MVGGEKALRALGDESEASIRCDAIEPGPQRAPTFETAETLPRSEKGLLKRVVRILDRTEHAVAIGVKLGTEGRDAGFELRCGGGAHCEGAL